MYAAAAIIAVFCVLRLPLLWYTLCQNGILDEKEAVDCAGSILARRTLELPVYHRAGTQIEMYAIPAIDSTGL